MIELFAVVVREEIEIRERGYVVASSKYSNTNSNYVKLLCRNIYKTPRRWRERICCGHRERRCAGPGIGRAREEEAGGGGMWCAEKRKNASACCCLSVLFLVLLPIPSRRSPRHRPILISAQILQDRCFCQIPDSPIYHRKRAIAKKWWCLCVNEGRKRKALP